MSIGDHCVINQQVGLQTHLFEDRIMKIGTINIGNFVTVETGSTVLYDTTLKAGCRVGPQSCVMKGEVVDKDCYCIGIPTRSIPVPGAASGAKTATAAAAVELVGSPMHLKTPRAAPPKDHIPAKSDNHRRL